jgi:hypothetical protein
MNLRSVLLLSTLVCTALPVYAEEHGCHIGETRCDAGGYVQECRQGAYRGIWQGTFKKCSGSTTRVENVNLCVDGDEKCGSDGHVLICEPVLIGDSKMRWRWTSTKCN